MEQTRMSGIYCGGTALASAASMVHIVDDNSDIRETAARLIRSIGFSVSQHPDGAEFLSHYNPNMPGCVVLDVAMPGMSGLEVQEVINALDLPPPIIFVTGQADVPHAVRALRAGAIDFLVKPVCAETLLERVWEAVTHDLENRRQHAMSGCISGRLNRLTAREKQVARLLSTGESVKHIAHCLSISPKTVENHRAKVLDKLEVDNPTQLANLLSHLPEFAN
jgi:FixJ family two-component response regulator